MHCKLKFERLVAQYEVGKSLIQIPIVQAACVLSAKSAEAHWQEDHVVLQLRAMALVFGPRELKVRDVASMQLVCVTSMRAPLAFQSYCARAVPS